MSLRVLLSYKNYKKINLAIFRQMYAADRSIKTAQTREIRAISAMLPSYSHSAP